MKIDMARSRYMLLKKIKRKFNKTHLKQINKNIYYNKHWQSRNYA